MSRGQASVAWRARPAVVSRAVLSHAEVLVAVMAVPLAAALLTGQWALAAGLAPGAALALAGMVFGPGPYQDRRQGVRAIEAAAVLVLLFVIACLLPLPGYLALGLGGLDALFESVSAITSTGLSVAETGDWPFAGHLLRAWMQWVGGFTIAVAGVALLLAPGPAATAMGEAGLPHRDLLSSARMQARSLLVVYCALTVTGIAVLVALFPNWQEGLLIALSAVSTGGFAPRADSLASYGRPAQWTVMLLSLAAAVSLMAYVLAHRNGLRAALKGSNAPAVLGFAGGGAAATALIAWTWPGAGSPQDTVLNYLSGVSTAGFSVAPVSEGPVALILLTGMAVGGGIGSSAGGIKVDRIAALWRMVRLALLRLRAPHRAVTFLAEGGQRVAADRIISIAAVCTLYGVSALTGWLIFAAAGHGGLDGLFEVVSALSTVGHSTGLTGPDLAAPLKAVLIAAMLLGRLEFLAVIAVLSPGSWMKR